MNFLKDEHRKTNTMMNKGTPRYKNKRLATVKERIKVLSSKLKRWQDEHDEIVRLQQPKTLKQNGKTNINRLLQ